MTTDDVVAVGVTVEGQHEQRALGCADVSDRVNAGGTLSIATSADDSVTVTADDPMRVVVADDVMLVRSRLARLLVDAGFDVVAEAVDAAELARVVARDGDPRPDR